MTIPTYLTPYVLACSVAVVATTLFGLNRALARADWAAQERTRVVGAAAVILILWLGGAITLGGMGAFHATSSDVPTIQLGIFLPILVGALLIWRSPLVGRIIDAVPQQWLVSIQVYRTLGVIFLILYASGRLPGLFAWPAGVGDILVGLTAPIIGLAYVRNPRQSRDLVAGFNVFGIGDLAIAVSMGFVTSPSLAQPFAVEPPNELITLYPLVLIPVFLVPISILVHLASLTKLRRTVAAAERPHQRALASA
jgi:hypothetical protein